MLTKSRRHIPVSASMVWALIGDFWNLAAWMPGVARVSAIGSGVGGIRHCETQLGVFEERLDAQSHYIQDYSVLRGSLGVQNYRARLRLRPLAQGCVVVWLSCFERAEGVSPEAARRTIRTIHRAGLDGIEQHFLGF